MLTAPHKLVQLLTVHWKGCTVKNLYTSVCCQYTMYTDIILFKVAQLREHSGHETASQITSLSLNSYTTSGRSSLLHMVGLVHARLVGCKLNKWTNDLCIDHTQIPGAGHLFRNITSHPGQLSLAIPSWIGATSTSQRAVMPCSWGVKAGMVCVWVADKTV